MAKRKKAKRTAKRAKRAKRAERAVVRGPQAELFPEGRTPRLRYIEPPTKKDGNPFFAVRVPAELLRAFKAHASKAKTSPTELVREYMREATGLKGEDE